MTIKVGDKVPLGDAAASDRGRSRRRSPPTNCSGVRRSYLFAGAGRPLPGPAGSVICRAMSPNAAALKAQGRRHDRLPVGGTTPS